MRSRLFLASLAALALGACAAEDPSLADPDGDEEIPVVGEADSIYRWPAGTFRSDDAAAPYDVLVLKNDRTFHAEEVVLCVRAPCPPISSDGTYRFSRRGDKTYIRFTSEDGTELGRYQYYWSLGSETLGLRAIGTEERYDFTYSADAWCAIPDDCALQMLATPRCLGGWTCESNACAYECDSSPPNECEQAGGECRGLRPGACDGMRSASLSCGGGLGVTCCLPAPMPPVCDNVGTRSEGWYHPDTGALICWARCSGHDVRCGAVGSRSEGWYTDAGYGCIGSGGLIGWDDCAD